MAAILVWIMLLPLLSLSAACLLVAERTREIDAATEKGSSVSRFRGRWPVWNAFIRRIAAGGWRPGFAPRQWFGAVLASASAALMLAVIPLGPDLPSDTGGRASAAVREFPFALAFIVALYALGVFGAIVSAQTIWATGIDGLWNALALALAVLGPVLLCGSAAAGEIAALQQRDGMWLLARQPLGFAAMWLCLIGHAAQAPAPPHGTAPGTADRRTPRQNGWSVPGVVVLASRIQTIGLAYLAVVVFLGAWHFWGLTGGVGAGAIGEAASLKAGSHTSGDESGASPATAAWLMGFVILHVKVLCVAAWLVWFFRGRRSSSTRTRLFRRAWLVAVPLGLLNLLWTAAGRQFFAGSALATAAVSWGILVAGLCVAGVVARVFEST